MKYKHIVFDIDGTLIDTEKTGVLSLIKTISELMGIDMPYEQAYGYFGIPSHRVAGLLGYEDGERFQELWEERFVEMMYLMKPFPGVEDMLAAIKTAGLHMGCVTSRNRLELEHDRHMARLGHYFDHIICSEDSVKHKPDPEPMLTYMRKAEQSTGAPVLPDECVYIGDTMHDCSCGQGAGCDFILADWFGRGMQGIPAQKRISSAEEILEIVL